MSRRWTLRNEGEREGGKEHLHRGKLKSVYVSNNLQDGTDDDAAQTLREGRTTFEYYAKNLSEIIQRINEWIRW